jgi:hypothetical protein
MIGKDNKKNPNAIALMAWQGFSINAMKSNQ